MYYLVSQDDYEVDTVKAGNDTVQNETYIVNDDTTFTVSVKEKAVGITAVASGLTSVNVASLSAIGVAVNATTGAAFELNDGNMTLAYVYVGDSNCASGAAVSFAGCTTTSQEKMAVDTLDFSEFTEGAGAELFTTEVLNLIIGEFSNVQTILLPQGVNAGPDNITGTPAFKPKS